MLLDRHSSNFTDTSYPACPIIYIFPSVLWSVFFLCAVFGDFFFPFFFSARPLCHVMSFPYMSGALQKLHESRNVSAHSGFNLWMTSKCIYVCVPSALRSSTQRRNFRFPSISKAPSHTLGWQLLWGIFRFTHTHKPDQTDFQNQHMNRQTHTHTTHKCSQIDTNTH